MTLPHVSVILPSYNEVSNVVPLIRELKRHLPVPHELLVIDDNSPDQTGPVTRKAFAGDPSVQVHVRMVDRGLATAIRDGIRRSTGDKVLVMVTDFNHDPAIVGRLVELGAGADMVIGSRFCPGGGMANRWRYACSRFYSRLVQRILQTGVRDNLCGYYLIRRDVLMALPFEEIFYGYGDYFFRLVWHVRRAGYSIVETPVVYQARPSGRSKSNLMAMLFGYTREVLKLRMKAGRARDHAMWSKGR